MIQDNVRLSYIKKMSSRSSIFRYGDLISIKKIVETTNFHVKFLINDHRLCEESREIWIYKEKI